MDPCGSAVPSTHAFVALHHPMRYTLRSLGGGKFDSIDPVMSTKTITLKVADLAAQSQTWHEWLQDAEGGLQVVGPPPAGVTFEPEPLVEGDVVTSVGGNPVTLAS